MTEGELIKAMKRAWVMLAKQEREETLRVEQNPTLTERVEVLKAWRRRK